MQDKTKPTGDIIRDPEFAKRLNQACDTNPHCPPLYYGRQTWLRDQMLIRFKTKLSKETIRKWLSGVHKPSPKHAEGVAEILGVDWGWLLIGHDPEVQPRERKARNAMADGIVNIVAGFIQMDGGHPAFPEKEDRLAAKAGVDLFAIIKGANYRIHVALAAAETGGGYRFTVPIGFEDVTVIAALRDGFSVKLYEIPAELVAEQGVGQGGWIKLIVQDLDTTLRPITGFSERF